MLYIYCICAAIVIGASYYRLFIVGERLRRYKALDDNMDTYQMLKSARWKLHHQFYGTASAQSRGFLLEEQAEAIRILDCLATIVYEEGVELL